MALKVGCAQFAVARARYFETLPTVEVGSAFIEGPRLATVEQWKKEAPKSFEFSLPASQVITHTTMSPTYAKILKKIPERRRGFCGHFKDSPEVTMAWEHTRALASALDAKFVVFETPSSFYADANHLRDMYRFFKAAPRGRWAYVWHPRGRWEIKLLDRVCADLGLVRARDPFEEPGDPPKAPRYYRLRGQEYTLSQLSQLRRLGEGSHAYAYFLRRTGWLQARKLVEGRA
jgi:uncharacterized protein YecE (DUF72 family)